MNPQKVIFCTQAYNYLRDKILLLNTDIEKGKIEIISFPDKEIYHRIENNLENKHNWTTTILIVAFITLAIATI